jgi:hypothetical protein
LDHHGEVVVSNLYYKERKQLKTFLTQFRPALPLTPDPPVKLHDDQKGGTTIKTQFGERFCKKRIVFVTRVGFTRTYTRRAHQSSIPPLKKNSLVLPTRIYPPDPPIIDSAIEKTRCALRVRHTPS